MKMEFLVASIDDASRILRLLLMLLLSATFSFGCPDVKDCLDGPSIRKTLEEFASENSDFEFLLTVQQLDTLCKEWKADERCYNFAIRFCRDPEEKYKYESFGNILKYTCGDGYDDYVKHSPCFTLDATKNDLKACTSEFERESKDIFERKEQGKVEDTAFQEEFCKTTIGLSECSQRVMERHCGSAAKETYLKTINHVLKPLYVQLMCYAVEGCKRTRLGTTYDGKGSQTITGRTCQRWDSQYPHKHTNTDPEKFPDTTLEDAANYCRNPDYEKSGPWCYTTDNNTRWEYCAVRACPKDVPSKGLSTRWILTIVGAVLAGLSACGTLCGCLCKYCCTEDAEAEEQPQMVAISETDTGKETGFTTENNYNTDYGKDEYKA